MLTALPNPTDWLFCTAPSYGKPQCSLWSQGSVTWAFIAAERGLRDICVQAFILQDPFVQVWVQYLCTGKSIRATSCTSAWLGFESTPLLSKPMHPPHKPYWYRSLSYHCIFSRYGSLLFLIYDAVFTLGKCPLPWAIHWKRPAAATH